MTWINAKLLLCVCMTFCKLIGTTTNTLVVMYMCRQMRGQRSAVWGKPRLAEELVHRQERLRRHDVRPSQREVSQDVWSLWSVKLLLSLLSGENVLCSVHVCIWIMRTIYAYRIWELCRTSLSETSMDVESCQ